MTNPIKIIGFIGEIGSGKSTASSILSLHNFHPLSFALPLKSMLRSLGLSVEQLYGKEKNNEIDWCYNKTPRELMQTLGTEWGRNLVGPDFWVNCWVKSAENYEKIVVDDIRFQNEFRMVKKLGGIIIRILRPKTESNHDHISEQFFQTMSSNFDLVNDGSKLDLNHKLLKILNLE